MKDQNPSPSQDVRRMFNGIAARYDFLNRLLSFRRDVAWRKALGRHLPERPGLRVLDLATGTGDVLLSLCRHERQVDLAVGVDVAEAMLVIARRKTAKLPGGSLPLTRADATALAFADASFDAVTMAFGIRNVGDVADALKEMRRVLAPGGRVAILEFSVPTSPLFRPLYLLYLRHILPKLGGLISGDRKAYYYLNRTIESFPCGEVFCDLLRDAGYVDVRAYPQTFGIATVYTGGQPGPIPNENDGLKHNEDS